MKKILALLFMIALSLTLFACTSSTCTEHVDADGDLKCDNCAVALPCTNHVDSDLTDELSVCDLCGAPIACTDHVDVSPKNLFCDVCGKALTCKNEGIKYEKTNVGDKYVYENMVQNGHSLGGEQSGHIIFSKHATTGDGILTSLKMMEVLIEKKTTLGTIASEVKIYPQLLENLRVTDKDIVLNHPDVLAAEKEVEEALGDNGRILVRASGTEPLLRVMVEAETQELCKKYVKKVIDAMKTVM